MVDNNNLIWKAVFYVLSLSSSLSFLFGFVLVFLRCLLSMLSFVYGLLHLLFLSVFVFVFVLSLSFYFYQMASCLALSFFISLFPSFLYCFLTPQALKKRRIGCTRAFKRRSPRTLTLTLTLALTLTLTDCVVIVLWLSCLVVLVL